MTAPNDTPPFYTRYGFSRTNDPIAPLLVEPYPEICHREVLRPTVIASAIDIVGGLFAREIAGSDATFTTDLSLRAPCRRIPSKIVAKGRLIRGGRRLLTTSVELVADGEIFAFGQTTFTRIERPPGESRDAARLSLPPTIERNPLERPLVDEVGVEPLDPGNGLVRVDLRDALRNPEGVMQGALIALITEVSAESLADELFGRPQVVNEMDIRYLSTARVGPIVGRASPIGEPTSRMIRVDLYDEGHADRLTTSSLVRVGDAPIRDAG